MTERGGVEALNKKRRTFRWERRNGLITYKARRRRTQAAVGGTAPRHVAGLSEQRGPSSDTQKEARHAVNEAARTPKPQSAFTPSGHLHLPGAAPRMELELPSSSRPVTQSPAAPAARTLLALSRPAP